MTLVDSQMVGDMRRTLRGDHVRFDVGLFRPLNDDELDAITAAAQRYGTFLGLDATLTTAPPQA